MSEMTELAERLKDACHGHPHAKIPWPHRILHEAAAAIERLDHECQASMATIASERARAEAAEAREKRLREAAYDQPHGPTSRTLWSARYGELLDDYKDLRAENEKMRELVQQAFRDGVIYGTNIADADPDLAWEYSRSRAVLSNTNEGGKDE